MSMLGYAAFATWKKSYDKRKAQTEKLAVAALERLKSQRRIAQADSEGRTLQCVAVPQLRDEILADVANLETRKKVWARVERQVESNANIRARQTEINGEIMRVWEWVGSV